MELNINVDIANRLSEIQLFGVNDISFAESREDGKFFMGCPGEGDDDDDDDDDEDDDDGGGGGSGDGDDDDDDDDDEC